MFSPDGTQIAFQSRRDGNLEIFRMKADGSGVVQLTHTEPPTFKCVLRVVTGRYEDRVHQYTRQSS